MGPTPIHHGLVILQSKASKSSCRSPKRDSGEHIKHASLTPGNTEYIKYIPPGAQLSHDALTTKIIFVYSFHLVIL